MKKQHPPSPKKTARTMEGYAAKRNSELKRSPARVTIADARPMIMHDPEGDLNTLMRAAEVKSDKRRHKAAKKVGQERVRQMQRVMAGAGGDE